MGRCTGLHVGLPQGMKNSLRANSTSGARAPADRQPKMPALHICPPVRGVTPWAASPASTTPPGACNWEACTRMPATAMGKAASWAAICTWMGG